MELNHRNSECSRTDNLLVKNSLHPKIIESKVLDIWGLGLREMCCARLHFRLSQKCLFRVLLGSARSSPPISKVHEADDPSAALPTVTIGCNRIAGLGLHGPLMQCQQPHKSVVYLIMEPYWTRPALNKTRVCPTWANHEMDISC